MLRALCTLDKKEIARSTASFKCRSVKVKSRSGRVVVRLRVKRDGKKRRVAAGSRCAVGRHIARSRVSVSSAIVVRQVARIGQVARVRRVAGVADIREHRDSRYNQDLLDRQNGLYDRHRLQRQNHRLRVAGNQC